MALIKCKECGNEVSTTAKACPKCGAKTAKKKPGVIAKTFVAFLIFAGVIAIFGSRDKATASAPTAPSAPPSPSTVATAPAPQTPEQVPFSSEPDSQNFGPNCKAITVNLNALVGYAASTCQARGGIVMIRATSEVSKRGELSGFTGVALGAAGWAVNEDYYGKGAQFVLKDPTKSGQCIMVSGTVTAYAQNQIKNEGADMKTTLIRVLAGAKGVECPSFLS